MSKRDEPRTFQKRTFQKRPIQKVLQDEAATLAFGAELLATLKAHYADGVVVFLEGNLGAGKTTLARGILRALGHLDAVKSPTYTLLESYDMLDWEVFHFDLYRLGSPGELEFTGFDEIMTGPGLKLIEWPEKGQGWLPSAHVKVRLATYDAGSGAPLQRQVSVDFA